MPKNFLKVRNSIDPDHSAVSNLSLHCLLRSVCPNMSGNKVHAVNKTKKNFLTRPNIYPLRDSVSDISPDKRGYPYILFFIFTKKQKNKKNM